MTRARPKLHITQARLKLLRFLCEADKPYYGVEICRATGLARGTIHLILRRFTERQWVTTTKVPSPLSAPPRMYYEITPIGRAAAGELLKGTP